MGVELRPLAAPFGIEVMDLDLRAGPSDSDRQRVVDAFFDCHLVLVRDQQHLSIDEQRTLRRTLESLAKKAPKLDLGRVVAVDVEGSATLPFTKLPK